MLDASWGELAWLALAVIAAGIVTGLLAGLFGIGGGAVIVPVLFEIFRILGVPDAVRSQVFQPFTTGGRAGGAGLGLAIARDLVRAHGGDIALLESNGKGTTFRFTLPV